MPSDRGCLGTIAIVLGIIASLLAIIGFVYTYADTVLIDFQPVLVTAVRFPITVIATVGQFIDAHQSTIWISAIVVYILTAIIAIGFAYGIWI